MIKLVALLKRKPSLTREEFRERWLVEHTRLSSLLPDCREYRINLVDRFEGDGFAGDGFAGDGLAGDEPPYDGTAELWWDTREAMEASFRSHEARVAGDDADAFCAARVHLYCDREWVVVRGGAPVRPPEEVE